MQHHFYFWLLLLAVFTFKFVVAQAPADEPTTLDTTTSDTTTSDTTTSDTTTTQSPPPTPPPPPPPKYFRQDIELDFSEENLEKQKRDPGACESVLGKAIMNLLNDYRALYNTTSKLSVPTTYNPVYEIDKDTMAWAWKLVDSKFNPKNRVIHQEDSRSRRFYGRDIVVQGSWSFDTRDPTGPGMAVLSMPVFLEAYFDRSRALYQKYYGTTTGKDDTTVVEAADLITFDPFTRLLWAGSADVGIGCSLKYTQEKSFFYLVVNINKKVGNAGQDQKPNELPPPLTLAELKANVLCQECARKDMSTDT